MATPPEMSAIGRAIFCATTPTPRAEVKEISGLLSEDLPTALREMQALAAQSRSHGNFMYQANFNPQGDEHLTPEQWREAVDTLEKNLGLEGHQRVVVEHEKGGRTHQHVVWNRVDVESLRVADMGGNYRIHTATARELESRFDLTPTPMQPALDRKPPLELWEIRAAERSGINPTTLKNELSELWRSTDSGKAFAAALDERGYVLAKGDRRDFCVIDQAGDAHSLARRLDGVKAKDVRERMSDLDRDSLPTVAEARAAQRETQRERAEALKAENPLLPFSRTPQAPPTSSPILFLRCCRATANRPPAHVDPMQQIKAQRKALAALGSIRDSMERGERLRASDIRNLMPNHLQNIARDGDDYLRGIIERMERGRERERDWGRARER